MYRIRVHDTENGDGYNLYADDEERAGATVRSVLLAGPHVRITVCRESSQ